MRKSYNTEADISYYRHIAKASLKFFLIKKTKNPITIHATA